MAKVVAGDFRIGYKLHLDAGINGADVLIEREAIQFESNVNVGASTSVRRPVNGDP